MSVPMTTTGPVVAAAQAPNWNRCYLAQLLSLAAIRTDLPRPEGGSTLNRAKNEFR